MLDYDNSVCSYRVYTNDVLLAEPESWVIAKLTKKK